MLSIQSTFHEIEHAHLKENKNVKTIANEMRVGEKKLRRLLTAAGYESNSSTKKWHYVLQDESKDVRNMSFWAFDEQLKGNTNITKPPNSNTSNTETEKSNMDSNISNNDNTVLPFTPVEIEVLRELVQLHISNQSIAATSTALTDATTSILERVQSLQSSKSERKTYVIDAELIQQFDAFCEVNRLKKSSVMSLAIKDLLEKYQ